MQLLSQYQPDYSGGLNDTAAATEIATNEASLLRNWDITYQGQLRRRNGLTLVGNAISTSPITGLAAFIRNGGSDLLCTENGNLYYLNSSTWTKIGSGWTNDPFISMEAIQVLGKIFMGSENNTQKSWDRAGTTLNDCLADLGADIPHGNIMRWFQNYMFVMNNVNVSGTKYPNRIYVSALGDPTAYTVASDFIDIPGEGRVITAIQAGATTNSDTLVVFKERSIQIITGYGISSWKITTSNNTTYGIDTALGCIAPRGVVKVGEEIYFIDSQAQIRKLVRTMYGTFGDGGIVSNKIRATLATLNTSQLANTVAWFHANKIYFAFPTGSDTTNTLVCVYDLIAATRTQQEAWTTYTGWKPSVMSGGIVSGVPVLYIGDATTGKIYQHTGNDDNGVAIDARWDGKLDFLNKPERYKRFKFGYIRASSSSSSAIVGVYASIDSAPFAHLGDISLQALGGRLAPTGTDRLAPTGGFKLGGASTNQLQYFFTAGGGNPQGRSLQMSIRHATVAQAAAVNTFSTHYKLKQLR